MRQIDDLDDGERVGWRYVAAIDGRSLSSCLAKLIYRKTDESELSGDAMIRLETGEPIIVREMSSFGDVGLYGLYCRSQVDDPERLVIEFMREGVISSDALLEVAGIGPEFRLRKLKSWVPSTDENALFYPVVLPPNND